MGSELKMRIKEPWPCVLMDFSAHITCGEVGEWQGLQVMELWVSPLGTYQQKFIKIHFYQSGCFSTQS